jgi:Domain of unknown function (DUF5658)
VAALLIQFSYLQVLDVLSTLAFLLNGVQEGNPLIRMLIGAAGSPLAGLVTAKALALALALYCWRLRHQRLLAWANTMYALLIVWNLVALMVRGAAA